MIRVYLKVICIAFLACSISCQRESATRFSGERASTDSEAKSNGSDTTLTPFWPASEKEYRIVKREIITSQYTIFHSSKLLKLRTELVEVTFDIQDVIEQFDGYFKEHPESDRNLAVKFRKESKTRSQFYYSEFSGRDRKHLHFCIADLLEQGKFIIGLRSNGQIVSQIIACEWSNVRGPLDGVGGRVFFLKDGSVFYWTMDWIS